MPTSYPAPGKPALSLSSVGGSIMRRSPYISPIYNLINSGVHAAQGTLGQHGPAPSAIGRITQALGIGNQASDWRQSALGGGALQQSPVAPAQPGAQPVPGTPTAPGPAPTAAMARIREIMNSGRVPEFPAFYPTLSQLRFPGSAIGPLSGGVSNPYSNTRGAQGLGTPNAFIPGIPGWAAAHMADVRARNIA